MAKNRIMILSDIHIGIDAMSNWYQSKVHQNMLIASLQWAQNPANNVKELVLLGDLVDLWTYTPGIIPPSFEVVTHLSGVNKALFGPNGELAKTVNALGKNNVVYVNGNHDMTVTADQIHSAISPDVKVMPINLPYYIPDLGPRSIFMAHGHIYSLLCANDYVNPPANWNNLPLGYFITRMSALLSNIECKKLKVKNAAYLKNLGNPLGFDVGEIIANLLQMWMDGKSFNLPDIVINTLQPDPKDHEPVTSFVMPKYNGQDVTAAAAEVEAAYPKLLGGTIKNPSSTWSQGSQVGSKYYANLKNVDGALIAFADTDAATSLTAWASALEAELSTSSGEPIIVMGHTHVPKDDDIILFYTNSGFNCPAVPDMDDGKKKPTFSVVEWKGNNNYSISVHSLHSDGTVLEDGNPKILSDKK